MVLAAPVTCHAIVIPFSQTCGCKQHVIFWVLIEYLLRKIRDLPGLTSLESVLIRQKEMAMGLSWVLWDSKKFFL